MKVAKILFLLISINFVYGQKFENLAPTPPMGWNSWNNFACDVDEELLMKTADLIASNGMKEAGYEYIVVDDCWHGERDSLGFITAHPEHFPSGIKALTDYIHSKGLKFGIYSCAGWETCAGKPGSRGYEYQDAMMYAKWGVDYLKYDWCNTEGLKAEGAYMTMRDALYKAGRPIVFSLCEWGDNQPWEWAEDIGQLWRTTGDIAACFDCVVDHGTWKSWGVTYILDMQVELRKYAGPNHWNDPDMMEVGNGLSVAENRSHFSMWCMLAAPLMAGNNIAEMDQETLDILTNKDVIAVDQDTLGIQGLRYSQADSIDTWFKPLSDGEWAVCFLNRSIEEKEISFDWIKNSFTDEEVSGREFNCEKQTYSMKNLWTGEEVGTTEEVLSEKVPSHDVLMLRLAKAD